MKNLNLSRIQLFNLVHIMAKNSKFLFQRSFGKIHTRYYLKWRVYHLKKK